MTLALRTAAAVGALWGGHYFDAGLPLYVLGYLIIAYPVLLQAAKNILHGEVFDEMFLMSIASLGAMAIGEYAEGIAVLALYQLGEFLQDKAVDSSRRSIRALMDIRPDRARIVTEEGVQEIPAKDVQKEDVIEVRAGDKIPLDGIVLAGASTLDTAALTGESLPLEIGVGSEVRSGCVNLTATLRLRVTSPYGEDSASRILALVEGAQAKKARSEQFIRRFARIYTPIVVAAAALVAFLPPLLGFGTFPIFVKRALNFLVISCPCAMVISVPLTFFSGIGCASSRGILVKGSNHLETLACAKIAVFDKTGTLTKGEFTVTQLQAHGIAEDELLYLAAYGEAQSNHPLARSIVAAYGKSIEFDRLSNTCETAGKGTSTFLDGKPLLVGNAPFLTESGIECPVNSAETTAVNVAYDGTFCGTVHLADQPKEGANAALALLKKIGIRRIILLSGDRRAAAERTAALLGIDEARGELLPEGKLDELEKLKERLKDGESLLYVGDGINDTPVLAAADVGIAMGAFGADAAMETADVVIMGDSVKRVAEAVKISKKTVKIARQNLIFSLLVKCLVLLMSAGGYVNLWAAVFADVGVCMLAIINALRAAK